MKTVNFGILGPGSIARRFAQTLVSDEVTGARLAAVASRDASRAATFGAEFGADRCYGYDDLAADDGVDIVYVATTHNAHFEAVRQMLAAGKHVLCEKPMCMTKREATALAALAREKNVLLMEAMWTRCLPAIRKAKQWVDDGKIGKVGHIDASFAFNFGAYDPKGRHFDPAQGGGAIYDAGVYPIEFVTFIAGKPDQVSAHIIDAPTGVDAAALINMRYAGGVLASARCGLLCDTVNDAHIYGTEGSIHVTYLIGAKTCTLFDAHGNVAERFESDFKDGFCFEINHAVSLVQAGKTDSDLIPIQDTIDCAEIFDMCLGR